MPSTLTGRAFEPRNDRPPAPSALDVSRTYARRCGGAADVCRSPLLRTDARDTPCRSSVNASALVWKVLSRPRRRGDLDIPV
ncbi:hypothetical protein PISMIDRAFT_274642 [Pisolithus microcarpus 441]|uniref:Uncharacterized protein n=1 Tax=Pisolithus microcarpus 441 TaxID=765257 RepID=A0A0C9ZAV1_9AGAM|nr:hypothetical protein PISMIDRAFT_274642 [Pisolithus microcarpus 441]